jgi:hypothetical protein
MTMTRLRDPYTYAPITFVVVAVVAVCLAGILMSARQGAAYRHGCEDRGGRVVNRHQDGGTCVTPDGRVIPLNPGGQTP